MPIPATSPEEPTATIAPGENEGSRPTSRSMRLKDASIHPRRLRFSPPQPGKSLTLTDRDYLFFELLNRFGHLPTTYLYELTRHLSPDYGWCAKRLNNLYHGFINPTADHIAYLTKPTFQGVYLDRPLIYDLTSYGIAATERKGIRRIKRKSEHAIHRFMGATVLASIAVYIEQAQRLHFIDQNEILLHEKTPLKRLTEDYPFSLPGKNRIDPDDFFAVQDPINSKKAPTFYAVEYDRNKETLADDKARNSVGGKMTKYEEAINTEAFATHLGIPNNKIKVLFITNNRRHKMNMQRWCKDHIKLKDRFLFAAVDGFQTDFWQIPPLMLVTFEDASGTPVQL